MKVSGRPYGEANTALIKIKIKLKPENDPTYELVTLLTDLVIASPGLYYSLVLKHSRPEGQRSRVTFDL